MSYISPEQKLKNNGAIELEIPAEKTIKIAENCRFDRVPLPDIMATDFAPIKWAIEGYVPEGFSVLAGRQKLGKTWLALDFALAVAIGGQALGEIQCEAGNVLYLDLENGHRRIKSRIEIMLPNDRDRPDLSNLEFVTESPQLDEGVIEALEHWRASVSNPRLVIIDVLQRIKPAGKNSRNSYENDYSIYQDLQTWATSNGVAVLGLHHTRKGGADDPLEALSGSNGLSAVADTTLVLNRDQNGMTLYVRGRDVGEKETAVTHNLGTWAILGDAADVHRSDERSLILSALLTADAAMTPIELVAATRMKRNNLDRLLYSMGNDGEIEKLRRGFYIHPERGDLRCELINPGKIGKIGKIGCNLSYNSTG